MWWHFAHRLFIIESDDKSKWNKVSYNMTAVVHADIDDNISNNFTPVFVGAQLIEHEDHFNYYG